MACDVVLEGYIHSLVGGAAVVARQLESRGGLTLVMSYASTCDIDLSKPPAFHWFKNDFWASEGSSVLDIYLGWGVFSTILECLLGQDRSLPFI